MASTYEMKQALLREAREVCMYCQSSEYEQDFTIMGMFAAARSVVLLLIAKRDRRLTFEFEEDSIGLQHLKASFDTKNFEEALVTLRSHIKNFREGRVMLTMRDFTPIEVSS